MPHRILVVDDDPSILEVLQSYLGTALRYDVTVAPDAETALDLSMGQRFDLSIIDVRLPGISGSELYTRLKNMQPEIEAIFFTADQDFERTMDFMRFELPADRVLVKPLNDYCKLTRLIIGILGPPTA